MKKKENPYAPVWRERWRPEGCYLKGLLKCGKQCTVENMGACPPPPLPNTMPEPNEGVTHLEGVTFGAHDYEAEYFEYCKARNEWHNNKKKTPEPKWSDYCRDPYAGKYIWQYVDVEGFRNNTPSKWMFGFQPYELWDPRLFMEMLLNDTPVVTAIHESARLDFPESAINGIARHVRVLFVTKFQQKYRHIRYDKIKSCRENDTSTMLQEWAHSLPDWDFHWKLCLDSIERSMTLIARCLVAHYSDPDNQTEWAMLIASHTPEDPELQRRLSSIQAEHERWRGRAYRIPKKDRRPPDVIEAERRAAAERSAAATSSAGISSLVKRVRKQRPDPGGAAAPTG